MAETDIPAKEPLFKDAVPAHIPTYEEQLATVESMMTCYDTPLTQAAGYTRDLLKTIIALRGREVSGNDPLDTILKESGECWPRTLRQHINAISRNNVMVGAREVWRILDALLPLVERKSIGSSESLTLDCCRKCERKRMDAEAAQGRFPIRLMVCCPTCGNKRCPKASNHNLACTGSNEPGQEGSVY